MPVHWTVSHPQRLVVAVTKDKVTVADIEQYFAGVTADGAMAYRKIFEITHAPMAASDESFAQAQTFAAASPARRPLAIFRELHAARQWLDAQPTPDSSS